MLSIKLRSLPRVLSDWIGSVVILLGGHRSRGCSAWPAVGNIKRGDDLCIYQLCEGLAESPCGLQKPAKSPKSYWSVLSDHGVGTSCSDRRKCFAGIYVHRDSAESPNIGIINGRVCPCEHTYQQHNQLHRIRRMVLVRPAGQYRVIGVDRDAINSDYGGQVRCN